MDRERLNMSVNTPASWSVHDLRTWLGMPSGPAALRGLTRLNVLLKSATENESPQSDSTVPPGHVGPISGYPSGSYSLVSLLQLPYGLGRGEG